MTINQKTSEWTLFACISIGAIIGAFILGYTVAEMLTNTNTINKTQNTPSTNSLNAFLHKQTETPQTKPFQELSDFNLHGSHFARTLALHEILIQADTKSLQQYWDEVSNFESEQFRQQIQESILQRWIMLNPLAALAAVTAEENNTKRTNLMKIVFQEWSFMDLNALLQYAEDVDLVTKEIVASSILQARVDLSPNELRLYTRFLDNEWLVFEYIDGLVVQPEIEWKKFLNDYRDQLDQLSENQFKVLQHLAHSWVIHSGVAAFQKMRDTLPPTFSLYETTVGVSYKLLDTAPNLAIDLVVDRIQREQDRAYNALAVELINEWSKVDSVGAFNHTKGIDARSLRQKLQNWAIINWSRIDPVTLMQEIENLPLRLQTFAHMRVLSEFFYKSPHQALPMLYDITPGSTTHREVAKSLAGGWIQQDLESALEWIKTDQSIDNFRDEVMVSALQDLAETNSRLALQTALQLPLVERKPGMESNVVKWVAYRGYLDEAISLLPQVRSGITRSHAYDSVIQRLLEQDDTDRALNLFFELSKIESEALQQPLATLARKSPNLLYDALEQIEDVVVQAEAARLLYYHNKKDGRFAETELEHLYKLIQSQPKSRMNRAFDRMHEIMKENR
ncbi:MAG: hypothetical protein F4166_06090 [Gammaproteobacteria bacterium]|nr:hypothetical protein [Gammaproteobacteria bacterium]MXX94910.1 hypothetical protein [Gammaproteobacteria bacterium]MYF53374.1 hypothetical protein [Gammaproteobacteria bacterium]